MLALSTGILLVVLGFVIPREQTRLLSRHVRLLDLPLVDELQLPDTLTPARLDLVNTELSFSAYDLASDVYYLPTLDTELSYHPDAELTLSYDAETDQYQLLAVQDDSYRIYAFIETHLPLMKIETIMGTQDKQRKRARVEVYDETNTMSEYMLEYNIRGGTSRSYEKKSYSLHHTYSIPMTMLGLPPNDKYVINSMYEDEYRIRDVLSWDIYSQFAAYRNPDDRNAVPAMRYIEVFIDDYYMGLYGLQEYLNEHKLEIEGRFASIYEVGNYVFPGSETPTPGARNWDALSIKYNNREYDERWDPMLELVDLMLLEDAAEFNRRADAYFDMENFTDYYLLIETLQARDNIWKNQFYLYEDGERLQVHPWDLDMTLGAYMDETVFDLNHVLVLLETGYIYPFHQLIRYHESFEMTAAERYMELRESFLSTENLVATADHYHELLRVTGAFSREHARWPNGPKIVEGQEEFIQGFIREHMDLLDAHFAHVLNGGG